MRQDAASTRSRYNRRMPMKRGMQPMSEDTAACAYRRLGVIVLTFALWPATRAARGVEDGTGAASPAPPAGLEQELFAENRAALVQEAIRSGDPVRGAIVFYQPYMTCTKCHSAGEETAHPLGPDL